MQIQVLPLLISLIPSIFLTLIALYYFRLHIENESKRRTFYLHKENQKQALPLRLQAYERMVLFLERITPGQLLVRTAPLNDEKKEYESLLIATIEQEFEHNLTQQVYMTHECWNIIKASKNATIALIRKTTLDTSVATAHQMRETILQNVVNNGSPCDDALIAIKAEIGELF